MVLYVGPSGNASFETPKVQMISLERYTGNLKVAGLV